MKKPIVVLSGPTASGKTALSFELAKKFNGEIICVDSMTVYKGMDIGTDKPTLLTKNKKRKTKNEKQIANSREQITKNKDGSYTIHGIKHHLLDIFNPDEEFNVAIAQKLIKEKVSEIQKKGKIPFLVGGSTLYIDSFVYGYKLPEVEPDWDLRKKLEEKSNEELFSEIVKHDPDAAWTIDKNNKRRLVRALEVIIKTGKPFSVQKHKRKLPLNILYLAIYRKREELYKKINERVDAMMESGFLDEVKTLEKKYDHNTAMQAAGYKQLGEYLDGKISLDEAIEKTKQVHRNFAKRQLTWLKRNKDVVWITNKSKASSAIKKFLEKP